MIWYNHIFFFIAQNIYILNLWAQVAKSVCRSIPIEECLLVECSTWSACAKNDRYQVDFDT